MKKITLVLALLLAFGLVMAAAQDATVTGEASMTVGYDIEDGTFGIVNAASSTLDLTLASGTVSSEMMDMGWYGWIEIDGFSIAIDEAEDDVAVGDVEVDIDTGDITAKIVNGPMYIQIWAMDGMSTDQAVVVEDDEDDDYAVEDDETGLTTDLADGSGGFTFGYMADMFDVAVHFATETGYDGTDPADNGHFLLGADFGVMAGPADVTLEVVRGIGVDETLGLGIGAVLDIDPVSVQVGFDGQLPDGGDFAWEVGAGVDGTFGPATAALDFIYGDATDMDLEVDVDLAVDPVALGVFFGGYDMFADYRIFVDGSFDATDQIGISFGGGYDSLQQIPVNLTVTMDLIPNTTFTLEYDTADVSTDNGAITFDTTISY